jgi:DNA-binding MarR family transcriptional regulator
VEHLMKAEADDVEETLEPEPQRHIGYLIRRAQQQHVAVWSRVASAEISSVQYTILVVLDRLGEASQRELCDAVDLDRSTIADLVARMERRGLLERRRDPDDARRKTVTLADAGRLERERLRPLVYEVQETLMRSMSPVERRTLRTGLRALLGLDDPAPSSRHPGRSEGSA